MPKSSTNTGPAATEPVITAEAVRLVLLGGAAAGWVTLNEPRIAAIATGVAALASIGASLWARARVTPTFSRMFDGRR